MTDDERLKNITDTLAAARPAIQADGGDIEFVTFDNDRVRVRLSGRCLGCALAMQTLGGIRRQLLPLLDRPVLVVPYED
jgi:Fe-S cluster biogenesis protein NfuA